MSDLSYASRLRKAQSYKGRIFSIEVFYLSIFILVLYSVVVNIKYSAAVPNDVKDYVDVLAVSADSSPWKRVIQIFSFVFSILSIRYIGILAVLRSISIPYYIACAWALASFVWAIDPATSLRRSVAMVILLGSISTCVNVLGTQRTLRAMYWFFAVLLCISLFSVALSSLSFFSFAIHPTNEGDQALVGNWRGVFQHKNVAGPVTTYALYVFCYFGMNRGKFVDWLLCSGAFIFLIGTRSKTALGLALFCLAAGLVYKKITERQNGNQAFIALLLFITLFAAIVSLIESDYIANFLSDPANLSGRVAIWMSLMSYVKAHVWLGAGYGSFWGLGYKSPIFSLAVSNFVLTVSQSHNGYLEILVTTGVIGLSLAVFALMILPFYRFVTGRFQDAQLYGLCFTMWLFGSLTNFTEAQFFSADKESWIFVVISISLVHNHHSKYVNQRKQESELKSLNYGL